MDHATRSRGLVAAVASSVARFAHGGVLAAGVLGAAMVLPLVLPMESVSFDDTGIVTEGDGAASAAAAPVAVASGAGQPLAVVPASSSRQTGLSVEMRRVRDYIAARYRVSSVALEPVLAAAEASGRKVGIDPLLIVAVMAVESSFNPFAESHFGAQGLMQVIPRFHMDKIGADAPADALFDPQFNVQVGTMVLREGLKRFGEVEAALQYYGGALNDPAAAYAQKVFAIKERLVLAARRSTTTGSTGA